MFADELVKIGHRRPDVVAITAAMLHPTGLAPFAEEFPDRIFDVGIAEQHAVTSAAGLAMGGLHPVVGLYSTFLNRAFDQVLLDVALHKCGVTFVLDRAGVTGDDGPSHNGMWDMSILQARPRAAPRRAAGRQAAGGAAERGGRRRRRPDRAAVREGRGVPGHRGDRARRRAATYSQRSGNDVLLVGIGSMAATAMDVAQRLEAQGFGVTVVDPRWVKPVDPELVELAGELQARRHDRGQRPRRRLRIDDRPGAPRRRRETPVRDFGIPQQFLEHAKRPAVLQEIGLTGQELARDITELIAQHSGDALSEPDTAGGRPGGA